MTSQGHKKHADIRRPNSGQFGRYELGLIGAPCNMISDLVGALSSLLLPKISSAYIDADHQASEPKSYSNLTDRIRHHRIEYHQSLNDFDQKILMSSSDLIFVNGNHFLSKKQIVICTEKKKESLRKKLERLSDVGLIILDNDIVEPHDFLKSNLQEFRKIPILKIEEIEEISNWIIQDYNRFLPKISGLVLAGGKSQRMGANKAFLDYHNMPQVTYACKQLLEAGIAPAISCRQDQAETFTDEFALIHDTFSGLGPFGAILSAFRYDPNAAWLVIACDQPLLSSDYIKYLINHRNPSKIATSFHNPETKFPEPLITIWEPRAYPRLLSFLSMGYSCPRKVLINSEIEELHIDHHNFMINANTPAEREQIHQILKE